MLQWQSVSEISYRNYYRNMNFQVHSTIYVPIMFVKLRKKTEIDNTEVQQSEIMFYAV